jgi:hypothetical protein
MLEVTVLENFGKVSALQDIPYNISLYTESFSEFVPQRRCGRCVVV